MSRASDALAPWSSLLPMAAASYKPHRAMAAAFVWYEHRVAVTFPVECGTGSPVARRT